MSSSFFIPVYRYRRYRAALCLLAALTLIPLLSDKAHARGCRETSDIVGERRCSRFGAGWDMGWMNNFSGGAGLLVHLLPLYQETFRRSFYNHADATSTELPALAGTDFGPQQSVDVGVSLRLTWSPARWFYLGTEVELGGGPLPKRAYSYDVPNIGPVDVSIDSFTHLAGGLLIGTAAPLGRVTLRAEVLLGGRAIDLSSSSPQAPCGKGTDCVNTPDGTQWLVEPRLIVDVWVQPWITLGALVGVDVVNNYAVNFGLVIARHGRAYGGAYRRPS